MCDEYCGYDPNEFVKPPKPVPQLRKPSRFKFMRWLRFTWSGSIIGCFACTVKTRYGLKCPHCGKQWQEGFPGG